MKNSYVWLLITLTALLTACGGGGGGDSTTGTNTGIAVDPYIVGAQFEEVSADGQTIQTSDASSEAGRFMFTNDISDGSIIRIKNGAEGLHANAPFTGVIKRRVSADDTGPVVVSPLTTLVANGMTPGAVVQMMTGAGFAGLTADRIFEDPMAGLVGQTGNVADGDLVLLQANLATHAFMAAIQDFNYGGVTTAAVIPVDFADCAAAVRDILNPTTYQELAGSRPGFTVGDMANAAARVAGILVDGIIEEVAGGNTTVTPAMVEQLTANAKTETEALAGNFYQSRTGGGDPTSPSANPAVGESLFASNCLGCHHSVASPPSSGGLNARFAGGSSHGGQTFTASEIADVAAYLDSLNSGTPPSTDPGTDPGTGVDPAVGESLFTSSCLGCHHSVASPPSSGGLNARFGGGSSHGGQTFTASEIADVAAYLDSLNSGTPPSTDPGTDPGTGVDPAVGESLFTSSCLGCHHSVASPPSSGGLNARFGGGSSHGGQTFTASEIADVAAYLDSLNSGTPPSTDPGTDPGTGVDPAVGESLFTSSCLGCHHSVASPPSSGGLNARFGGGSSHGGQTFTASEIADVAAYLDSLNSGTPPTTDPGTDPGTGPSMSCDSCHGYPETSGAHTVHLALNGVDCDSCHANNNHNDGWVDLNFPTEWDAASGPAMDNGDLTCSNIICHGGEQTPDWNSGSISVASQCQSCHASGNSEYNSYSSGEHRKHVNGENIDCQTCHDPDKLASIGHFNNLSTSNSEFDAAASLQDAINFDGNQTCTTRCHDRGEGSW